MRPTTHPTRHRLLALAAAGAFAIGAASCGSDDESEDDSTAATSTVADDLAAYCADEVALDQVFQHLDSEDPAAFSATLESSQPLVDRLVTSAPGELGPHLEVLRDAYAAAAAGGSPEPFFDDAVAAADDAVHAFDLEHCGWTTIDIAAADYHFGGDFPATPGAVNLTVTNMGEEPHALIVARKHDDVAEAALDAFQALTGEEDLPNSFDEVATVFAEPGGSDYALAELTPGEYVAFCPIPVGATPDDPEGNGTPHFAMGMVTAFTVS